MKKTHQCTHRTLDWRKNPVNPDEAPCKCVKFVSLLQGERKANLCNACCFVFGKEKMCRNCGHRKNCHEVLDVESR